MGPVKTSDKKHPLPLVRLNLVSQFLEELDRRHIAYAQVLQEQSVTAGAFADPDILVPAARLYAIVERLSEISGDRFFGLHIGEKVDLLDLLHQALALSESATLAELLLRFIDEARHSASSMTYTLTADGDRAIFQQKRFTDGGLLPAHNDAFAVASLLRLVRQSAGRHWRGSEVIAQVCDPAVIPPGYLGIRVAATDTLGASVSFPMRWLLEKPAVSPARARAGPVKSEERAPVASSVITSLRAVIRPHIHEFNLDAARIAQLLGFSRRTLDRLLREQGTSAHREVIALRRAFAERELREGDLSVATIAARVGYASPAVFSRAFKQWTGVSPTSYRRTHRQGSND